MIKKYPVLFVVMAFVVGAVVGGLGAARYYTQNVEAFMRSTSMVEAGNAITCLKYLRTGNTTNALELTETQLDGGVIGLWIFLADVPEPQRDPMSLKMLQRAKDYRALFPRLSGSPEASAMVAKAFAMVKDPPPH